MKLAIALLIAAAALTGCSQNPVGIDVDPMTIRTIEPELPTRELGEPVRFPLIEGSPRWMFETGQLVPSEWDIWAASQPMEF
jgi:hypothetical protein